MKGRKNWYMTLKSAWLAFDTARYKGKGKSHCIPDPQKNPLKWIAGWDPVWHKSWHWWHSPRVLGYLAWTRRLLGLYQWALAHPLGAPKPCRLKNWRGWQHIWACDGFYFSQARYYRLQSPAQQYQWSWPRWYSFTGKNQMTPASPLPALANSFQNKLFLPVCGPSAHFLWSYMRPRYRHLTTNHCFYLLYCVVAKIGSS